MNTLKDYIKRLGWKTRLAIKWEGLKSDFLAIIGLCKHEGTAGGVGEKIHYCLACRKEVENEDWEEERKILNKLKK